MMNENNINLKDIVNLKQKDLLNLPLKPFSEVHIYDSIIVCPTRKKHDSGWRLMALIGCKFTDNCPIPIPVHIIGYCDDINWRVEHKMNEFLVINKLSALRCDMILSNCIRFWSNEFKFKVGMVISSTDIYILPR